MDIFHDLPHFKHRAFRAVPSDKAVMIGLNVSMSASFETVVALNSLITPQAAQELPKQLLEAVHAVTGVPAGAEPPAPPAVQPPQSEGRDPHKANGSKRPAAN